MPVMYEKVAVPDDLPSLRSRDSSPAFANEFKLEIIIIRAVVFFTSVLELNFTLTLTLNMLYG